MNRLLTAAAAAAFLAACSSRPLDGDPTASIPGEVDCQWATVRHVTDGDTVRVDFEGGAANQPVRYIGIDTPETVHPELPVQPFGPEASARNAELVLGRRLCLERDVSELDRYGRLLRYAWLPDGMLVNEVLLLEGLAVLETIPPDVEYVERFIAAQSSARDAGRGLWED